MFEEGNFSDDDDTFGLTDNGVSSHDTPTNTTAQTSLGTTQSEKRAAELKDQKKQQRHQRSSEVVKKSVKSVTVHFHHPGHPDFSSVATSSSAAARGGGSNKKQAVETGCWGSRQCRCLRCEVIVVGSMIHSLKQKQQQATNHNKTQTQGNNNKKRNREEDVGGDGADADDTSTAAGAALNIILLDLDNFGFPQFKAPAPPSLQRLLSLPSSSYSSSSSCPAASSAGESAGSRNIHSMQSENQNHSQSGRNNNRVFVWGFYGANFARYFQTDASEFLAEVKSSSTVQSVGSSRSSGPTTASSGSGPKKSLPPASCWKVLADAGAAWFTRCGGHKQAADEVITEAVQLLTATMMTPAMTTRASPPETSTTSQVNLIGVTNDKELGRFLTLLKVSHVVSGRGRKANSVWDEITDHVV